MESAEWHLDMMLKIQKLSIKLIYQTKQTLKSQMCSFLGLTIEFLMGRFNRTRFAKKLTTKKQNA